MKRILLLSFALFIAVGLIGGGVFYYKHLRGVGTAFGDAPADIAEIIDEHNNESETPTPSEPGPSENTSGFPLQLPPGFSISVYARGLGQPRVMTWDPRGNMLVSIPGQGNVVALIDADQDGKAEKTVTVASGLNKPHGIVFRDDELYIAETNRLAEYTYNANTNKATLKREVMKLPTDGYNQHYTRTLMLDPQYDDRMLVSVGSSCNVCHEEDDRRAKILGVSLETGEYFDYAIGLRNAVFMTTQNETSVWATEMGRDLLGDNIPPDEVNVIVQGKNYGWPTCYGKNIHDGDFDTNTYIRNPCMEPFETPSHIDLQAHSAPLGLAFVPYSSSWPEELWGDLLVAYHGSWNRSQPTGYKVVRFSIGHVNDTPPCPEGSACPDIALVKEVIGPEEPFITGWLTKENQALGRPVALLFGPDDALYISDDKAGVIYRVTYRETVLLTENVAAKSNLVTLTNLKPNDSITSPLTITGKARGNWFFEASFPVSVIDAEGKELGAGIAQAEGEWMTAEFVPFTVALTFSKPSTPTGFLLLKKDNPSGLPQNDDQLVFPVRFK